MSREREDVAQLYEVVLDLLRLETDSPPLVLVDSERADLLGDADLERVGASSELRLAYFLANRSGAEPAGFIRTELGGEVFDRTVFPIGMREDPADWWGRVVDHYGRSDLVLVRFAWPGVFEGEAIVNYWVDCGILCFERHVSRLRFVDGRWVRVSDVALAIS